MRIDAKRCARFLARHPSAETYCDFGDFRFLRFALSGASLNGGFARAYAVSRDDLVGAARPELRERLARAAAHMNDDHRDSLDAIARSHGQADGAGWQIVTIDAIGFEIALNDRLIRVEFEATVAVADDIRPAFVGLAQSAQLASPIANPSGQLARKRVPEAR